MRRLLLLLGLALVPRHATGQASHLEVQWPTGDRNPSSAIVGFDMDDDNDDRVPDALEQPSPDAAHDDDVVQVRVSGAGAGAVRVHCDGGVRVATAAGLQADLLAPVQADGRADVALVGVSPSRTNGDAGVTFSAPGGTVHVAITVVGLAVLDGQNEIVWGHRDAVRISHAITNDDTLPRNASWGDTSPDKWNIRAEVWDPGATRAGLVRIESVGTRASVGVAIGGIRNAIGNMIVDRGEAGTPLRSRFVRLVGDETDLTAPGVSGQTLLVGLRDRVRVRYRRVGAAGEVSTDVRVGRPGNEDGPLAARRARWHLVVMRDRAGGRPMIGGDDASAIRIAREQVTISNEIYLQCMITFGDPQGYPVAIDDPPEGSLLSVSDDDGFTASGGELRLRVGGRSVGPVRVLPGWRAIETAEAVGDAIRAAGFATRVTLNRRTDYGADGSADVVVRDGRGHLVSMAPPPGGPITTDRRQSIAIGHVDFTDGLDEFNNLNSSAGTLEERTLLKSLMDDDVTTIDLFVVNHFTHQSRIGEAFVEGDGGAVVNALIVDRAGIAAEREAWTQSHEAGHIFLNQPWHPDNMGPDRPWLLMDADASLGAVTGPKRLEEDECERLTAESGVQNVPSLLERYDPLPASPHASEFVQWPAHDPWYRPAPAPHAAASHASARPHTPDRPAGAYGLEIR